MRMYSTLQFGLIIGLEFGAATAGQGKSCDGSDIRVIAPTAEIETQVCNVVARAIPRLERCHLVQNQPLTIRVQHEAVLRGFLAHYSLQKKEILLPAPDLLTEHLSPDSAYRVLPTDQLFASFIVHEITHAFFVETECGLETCRAGHEYIAYAMQLDFMPDDSRALLLAQFPTQDIVDFGKFSDFYHDLMPEEFGVDAWRHFAASGNGCDLIGEIMSGTVVFSPEYE